VHFTAIILTLDSDNIIRMFGLTKYGANLLKMLQIKVNLDARQVTKIEYREDIGTILLITSDSQYEITSDLQVHDVTN